MARTSPEHLNPKLDVAPLANSNGTSIETQIPRECRYRIPDITDGADEKPLAFSCSRHPGKTQFAALGDTFAEIAVFC